MGQLVFRVMALSNTPILVLSARISFWAFRSVIYLFLNFASLFTY